MSRQLFQYHPTVGYHFIPGLKARVDHAGGGYLLRTNPSGFRCRHEFVRAKRPGTARALLFGDSFTAGDGVSDGERYGEILESRIPGLEVFNFGLSGSGTDQQYLIYREFAAGIEHDLVILAVLVENIRRVEARYRPYADPDGRIQIFAKPYFTVEPDGALALHHVPVPREPMSPESLPASERGFVDRGGRLEWLRASINRLAPGLKDHLQRLTRYQPLPHYNRPDHPGWRLLKAILEAWTREIRVPVVIFVIPLYHYVEQTASAAKIAARFSELDDPPRVTVHDPLPDLLRFPKETRRAFRYGRDPHLTPLGHRALAESLEKKVRGILRTEETPCR